MRLDMMMNMDLDELMDMLVDLSVEKMLNELDEIETMMTIAEEVEPVKCTDIEKAIAVLDGSCTDMTEDDFDSEVWLKANEKYYSYDGIDYREEVSPEGETIIIMSGERLVKFLTDRANTIASWDEEDKGAESIYIYEDDEVNVPEDCGVIISFSKAFDCMMPNENESAPESRLDALLDIIIENQDEYLYNYEHRIDGSKKILEYSDIKSLGLTADDLTDEALARCLYKVLTKVFITVYQGRFDHLFEDKDEIIELLDCERALNIETNWGYFKEFLGITDDIVNTYVA